jgi:spermidine/putrescine transport system permease protein
MSEGRGTIAAAEIQARPLPRRHTAPVRKRLEGWILPAYTAAAIVYLLLPIAVMIAFGFNNPAGRFNFTWQGFTFDNYLTLFRYPQLTEAIRNSLLVATVATVFATTIGTMIGLGLTRYRFRGRGPAALLVFMPIATPEVVLGASLLSLFVSMGMPRDLNTVIIGHILFNISFVVVTVRARIAGFERTLEEAAMDLGANELTTFRKVTFPLIFPGILAAAMLAFALSIDDFVISLFTAGQTVTFPLWVYGVSRFGVPPQVNVMGTLIFVIAVIFIIGWILLQRRSAGGMSVLPEAFQEADRKR